MSINSYQVLVTVTEQGSFIKASHILNITSSAVSHCIAGLEKEFGYPLLTRGKAGITLTSYGEALLPYIRLVLSQEAILRQKAASLSGLDTGKVRLGSFSSICTTHLPKLLMKFRQQYPGIEVEINQGTYADIIGWLKNGIVEIGFISGASAQDEVPILPVYRDELLCIVPKDFPVLNREFITHDEIMEQEFIAQQESTDSDIQNYLKKYQLKVRAGCYVSDDLAAVSLVSNGFGICIIPELVMKGIPYAVDKYSLHPKGFRTIGISCLKEKNLSPAARKLYESILTAYREREIG
jgi:DNA-binding transcriptional LysR family regulator